MYYIMKFEELPEDIQKEMKNMKYYSQTLQADISDAMESSNNLEEFRIEIHHKMSDLIGEINKILGIFENIGQNKN